MPGQTTNHRKRTSSRRVICLEPAKATCGRCREAQATGGHGGSGGYAAPTDAELGVVY
jgi:hypothetical protein